MENLNLPPYFPGNKAICIAPTQDIGRCWNDKNNNEVPGPKFNEEVTIIKYHFCEKNGWNLILKEYQPNGEGYGVKWFKPIQESPFPSISYSKVVKKESELISNN